ncbi:MAG: SWIM zinc finger domain-containing protein [Treponema sp.]|nr:SWIM zinc finger domain-containing protein [Treponema sp.]
MTDIIDLRETSPNHWQAKYQGNYGVYTIRITISEGKTTGFSCSCPSDRYPCKHIAMIESAIAERIAKNTKAGKKNAVNAEELLKILSREELYEFIARLIRYNPELTNAVILEFSHKIETPHQNKYSLVLRRALETMDLDGDDCYEEDWLTIDVLDQWFEKAHDYLERRNYREAVLIAQACIEEFAYWRKNSGGDMNDWVHEEYQTAPFEILKSAAASKKINIRELFDYCMEELPKEKYAETFMYDEFNDLLLELSQEDTGIIDAEAFITLQDAQLEALPDKSSYAAQKILQRKIDYYRSRHKHKKAWNIIEENIRIPAFRKTLAEKKIGEHDYGAAKKLIHDFLNEAAGTKQHPSEWDDLLLTIARKEDDTAALRDLSRLCIDDRFRADYFALYKSSFTAGEWADAMEDLIAHYQKNGRGFNTSVANVLTAVKSAERLLAYIEKHLSVDRLNKYYTVFANAFPAKTLALFRKAVDKYAADNVGRSSYEYIAGILRKMADIPDGGAVVAGMIDEYRILYKKRRAMMEVLGRV